MTSGHLSEQEIDELMENISKPGFRFLKKLIIRELDRLKLKRKEKNIDIGEVMNLIVISLSSIDTNILIMARNIFKQITNEELDFAKLMYSYFKNVTSTMNKDELNRLKEKMN